MRYKQIDRRLAKLEQVLERRAQCAATPLYVQVDLEAQQQLPPEDLPLLQSAKTAQQERRFHSLEEHAVMEKFSSLRDVVARRYGFGNYGWVIRKDIDSRPNSKRTANGSDDGLALVKILNWGRDNCNHLRKLRDAQQASQSNSFQMELSPEHEIYEK
jgi:hypothetical protein